MIRRPVAVGLAGLVIVTALAGLGTQPNVNGTQLKYFPGTGTAIAGREQLATAGISSGVMKPFDVLVENGGTAEQVAATLRSVPGVVGAAAPTAWRRGPTSLVEGFPAIDGAAARHPRHRRPRQHESQRDRRQAYWHRPNGP